ncbi:MAG: hypothetical protein AABM30_05405 [Actinomycetota bacterium]
MQALLAYLDPGSGSMLLQLLLGGAAAVGIGFKMTWRRMLRFLRLDKKQSDPEAPAA